jgi:aryl-alcohol dehydrogenase-like predicted oxidoreductase
MSEGTPPTIGTRSVPGTQRSFSAVTISLDPPLVVPSATDDRTVALLRRARSFGITTFDVATARYPPRAERLIAHAFPDPDSATSVIVGRSFETLAQERRSREAPEPDTDVTQALERSLEESRRRLGRVPISMVDWVPSGERSGVGNRRERSEPTPPASTSEPLWVTRLSDPTVALPTPLRSGDLFSGNLSLLEPQLISLFEEGEAGSGARLIARDPFNAGRLDGSRFAAESSLPPPGAGPVDVRKLQAEYEPVLQLGFLTEDRRRTLAQAALQFVLHWPWVLSVAVPLPTPERFDEVFAFASRPPISPDELTRLGFMK